MNKKNKKSSSKSTERRTTTSWLQFKFRFCFPETLWLTSIERHAEKLVGLVARCCYLVFLLMRLKLCDPGHPPALTGDNLGAQEQKVTFIPTYAQLDPLLNPTLSGL